MKLLRWLLVLTVVLVGVPFLVGALLPQSHSATVSRTVQGSPAEVWEVITDFQAFPSWRSDLVGIEVLSTTEGAQRWRELSSGGSLTFGVSVWQPPIRLMAQILDEGLPFGGAWTYRLEPSGEGTTVVLTEDGEIYAPVFRFVARFVLGYERTMLDYLDALEARMSRGAGL